MQILISLALAAALAAQQPNPRARDLGVPFDGTPGPLNAITDVAGVEVGLITLIHGDGPLVVGKGPVRTGVTAILPRGKRSNDLAMAGWFSLNGNGEMTGTTWVKESGFLEGPVFITNTHSVGMVRDASIAWALKNGAKLQPWSLPVVAETWDGALNDINGFHVRPEHVFRRSTARRRGAVKEGNVGGGTGMICYQFKCGTGTASRNSTPTRGNTPSASSCRRITEGARSCASRACPSARNSVAPALRRTRPGGGREMGSIIIVVATDAPLLPHQLERIARRASLGLARTGATSGNGSGDIFIAFSTANANAANAPDVTSAQMLSNDRISPLFSATVEATEEAIVNALVAGETMTGANGRAVEALPHDRLEDTAEEVQDGRRGTRDKG